MSLVVAPAHLGGEAAQPSKKLAGKPEQAVKFLVAASKAGDLPAALKQIAQPFRGCMQVFVLEEEIDDLLRAALDAKFGKEQRKGFRMEVKRDLLRIRKIEILSKTVKSKGRVKFIVRETVQSFGGDRDDLVETAYLAIKEKGGWKLLRPFTALVFGYAKQKQVERKGLDGKKILVFQLSFAQELDDLGRTMQAELQERQFKGKKLPAILADLRRLKSLAEQVAKDIRQGKYKTRNDATAAFENARK
jgi:hypothetical protein